MVASGFTARIRQRTTEASVTLAILVHLGLLVVAPKGLDIGILVAVETVVLLVMIGLELLGGVSASETIPLAGGFVALLATTWGLQRMSSSFMAASVLLVAALAVVVYTLHRYELVVLGLVNQ